MSKSKAVREAEARLAERKVNVTDYQARVAAAEKAEEGPTARWRALRARHGKTPALYRNASGTSRLETGLALATGYGIADVIAKLPKGTKRRAALIEVFVTGGQKIETSRYAYGTVVGASRKIRVPSGPDMALVEAARRRRERAEKALTTARAAEKAAVEGAYDRGSKVEPAVIAAATADVALAYAAIPHHSSSFDGHWQLERLQTEVSEAEQHLAFAQGKLPDETVCPCRDCKGERRRAELDAAVKADTKRREAEAKVHKAHNRAVAGCPICDRLLNRLPPYSECSFPVKVIRGGEVVDAKNVRCPDPTGPHSAVRVSRKVAGDDYLRTYLIVHPKKAAKPVAVGANDPAPVPVSA
jgi:hypothetical protein